MLGYFLTLGVLEVLRFPPLSHAGRFLAPGAPRPPKNFLQVFGCTNIYQTCIGSVFLRVNDTVVRYILTIHYFNKFISTYLNTLNMYIIVTCDFNNTWLYISVTLFIALKRKLRNCDNIVSLVKKMYLIKEQEVLIK